ncbi:MULTISPECIES: CPBP family intramembrane glutamic endopeptidase [Niastella]|uniref:CPBP family intramembrane metalloprotease n=1 Tax=Niastella soli TaxID=2821487 RepID=A0ABS3YTN3_9BACT|nr:type II CAAX endopeptidase family protein [Niastella soli]MBO9201245.1 CPBP family intramembrane metalloprotease [Niastella soli]
MTPGISTPLIKQGWLRAVLLYVAFSSGGLLAGIASGLFTLNPADSTAFSQKLLNRVILALFIFELAGMGLAIIFRRYIDRRPVKSLGFQWQPFQRDALIGFCLGLALLGTSTLLLLGTHNLEYTDAHFAAADLFTGLVLMILIAFTEEMVFRGYILNNLMESMNKWAALGVSAVLFTMAHGSNPGISFIAVINLFLAGLLLGINFIYTRNIWFAICFHFSWNFLQGPVLGYEVSGLPLQSVLQPALNGPWWITGGAFGVEGSFVATGLLLLALLLLYAAYEKQSELG